MVSRFERNIVKEILRECLPKNLHPNEDFVMYFLKLLLLDPNWGITDNLLDCRSNVQLLVKYVITELESKQSAKMLTLKLQFYFMWSMDHISDFVVNSHARLSHKLSPLKEQIMITKCSDAYHLNNLRKVIIYYGVFLSGLGNPLYGDVFQEGFAALKSIMSDDELRDFSNNTRSAKEEQLKEIIKLIAGIRLFNKYCEKGGADIRDLGEIYRKAEKLLEDDIMTVLSIVLKNISVRRTLFLEAINNDKYFEYVALPKADADHLEVIKDELIHFLQNELFIKQILKDLEVLNAKVEFVDNEISTLMEKILEIVKDRLAVPVILIFPLFEELADHWIVLQDHIQLLVRYNTIITNMKLYCNTMRIKTKTLDELSVSGSVPIVETPHQELISENPNVQIYQAHELAENTELQYLGFCCWKMVKTQGLLVSGNSQLGIAKYKDKYYVFSSYEAGVEFTKKPERHLNKVLALARTKPQLINFLVLNDELTKVSDIKILFIEKKKVKKIAEKAIQSEDSYVIPPYRDKLSWNIWDIKRNCLQLANLTKCRTTSMQTIKSHATNSVRSQTFTMKNISTQTHIDKTTSVPTPLNFIYGLRGRKDDKQFVIKLTRPIEQ